VQAVQAAQMRSFDLILMDMQMPNMDGLTATRKIRALDGGRQVPIIAMTANAMKDDQRRCLEAGMDDYISKPFMPQQLLDIIAKWMNKPQPDAGRDEPGRIDSANQIPVFDENAFAELRSYVPEDRLEAMLKLFLAQIHEQTRSVTELWEQRSFPQIAQVAHQLISTAGMVGARQLQHLASRLEETCRAEKTAAAGSLVEALRAASDAVRRIIENLPQPALQPA
jgi:DNA-binding response OmpR family regulator